MAVKKNVVAGLGEVGMPIFKLVSKYHPAIGYDIDEKLTKKTQSKKFSALRTSFLHVCIPFNSKFQAGVVSLVEKFKPETVVIHSTVSPYTTQTLQKKLKIPVIYSATRGVHKRMLRDLQRYTKFFALEKDAPNSRGASLAFSRLMKKCGVKTKKMSKPLALELAKIVVDTSYYGWLINYAQISNTIAQKHGIDYDEMWSFADEIHKYLGNRPKMFPGYIGGHCLDGNEILFIKTDFGVRPISIRDYVENDYQNDVVSYDPVKKRPIFDEVTTRWKRRFSGTMVSLESATNRSIKTTDQHIMLVSDSLSERYAKDIRTNDYIPFIGSLPYMDVRQTCNFESENLGFDYNMPSSISITPEFCRLLGYYVSGGSVDRCGKEYVTRFSFNKNETDCISDVCDILESLNIKFYKASQKNVTEIGIKSSLFSLFISDTLGCGGSFNKCLPDFIYFAPQKMKDEFIYGCFRNDGSIVMSFGLLRDGTLLKAGLDLLLLSMGYVVTKASEQHSVIQHNAQALCLLVPKKETRGNNLVKMDDSDSGKNWHMINGNLFMIKTTKTAHEEKEQDVYSIDTKGHLFVSTGGRVIHNCVIPNLELIDEEQLWQIDKINNMYAKKVKNAKDIAKKYARGKRSYDKV